MKMHLVFLIVVSVFFSFSACDDDNAGQAADGGTDGDTDGDADGDTDSDSDDAMVNVSVELLAAVTSQAPDAFEVVNAAGGSPIPAEDGAAMVPTAKNQPFELIASASNYADYHLFGMAGEEDFSLTSFCTTETVSNQVLGMLGITPDSSKGYVVVGMDTPSLAPAVGACASIDAESAEPFIFVGGTPQAGNQVVSGGSSFVTFPNTAPGEVNITVTPPDGQTCYAFPGPEDLTTITAYAGAVAVISYTCI